MTKWIDHPLAKGIAPEWASEWGEDRFGVFAGFRIGEVAHRMRWIPSGTFLMGSPKNEDGRLTIEGPQRLVKISRGFWLGETVCTQELWNEVMGENPSRFKSPTRPVEQVSWHEAGEFIDRLNQRVHGSEFRLPSEAEWEYACRAGTSTSSYVGEVEFLGEANAPLLDEIAWYRGNSGVEFELSEGVDSTEWEEKQYPHTTAGTRPVMLKKPNPWGLYDMLGNVWEWCSDWYGEYDVEDTEDPRGPEMGEGRVGRGGSWVDNARYVRAAARLWWRPSSRFPILGFRLSRGQAPAGPAEPEGGGRASRR